MTASTDKFLFGLQIGLETAFAQKRKLGLVEDGVRRVAARRGVPGSFCQLQNLDSPLPPSVSPSFSISFVPKEGGRASGVEKGSCMQGHPRSARPPTDWKAAKMDKVVK